jgi:hypothetical protein
MLRDRLNALLILCLFVHNWLGLAGSGEGPAGGRRYPPAMAIGLTDHIWTWEEFLTFKHYQYPYQRE